MEDYDRVLYKMHGLENECLKARLAKQRYMLYMTTTDDLNEYCLYRSKAEEKEELITKICWEIDYLNAERKGMLKKVWLR